MNTAIIGGGASGLFCAANLHTGKGAVLFERSDRLGRKLSATGNGQGNVTNEHVGEISYFSSEPELLPKAHGLIERHGRKEMVSFLESLGGIFLPDERGRVYPAGRQASAVTDLLRYAVSQKGVTVRTGVRVLSLTEEKGIFVIEAETPSGRERVTADNVVLCAGGKAAKNFGTDGSAYALAERFGHTVTPLFPSLVQLKTDTAYTKSLKGIRVSDARVRAYADGELLAEVCGDVIFTDYGVSGDAVFRLSAFVSDKTAKKKVSLSVDLLPAVSEETLAAAIECKRRNFPDFPEGELLCGIVNNQVGRAVTRRCKSSESGALAAAVKNFSLTVTGTLGFDYAQVTKGGIPLSETDENLQSIFAKGLYFAGEILDVDGECGGYNLQWAYSSARTVADEINAKNGMIKES